MVSALVQSSSLDSQLSVRAAASNPFQTRDVCSPHYSQSLLQILAARGFRESTPLSPLGWFISATHFFMITVRSIVFIALPPSSLLRFGGLYGSFITKYCLVSVIYLMGNGYEELKYTIEVLSNCTLLLNKIKCFFSSTWVYWVGSIFSLQ